jgi:ABC-type sugar transport system permease subunit
MTCPPCNPLFDGWQLTIPGAGYLLVCLLVALGLRGVQSVFRAWAVQRGDFPHDEHSKKGVVIEKFGQAFWHCFGGFNQFKEHSDLWLQFLINVMELIAYPVLLVLGQSLIIGGWIGIRTAGGWTGWSVSRTSFMRFLFVSLLILAVSYLWLSHYIKRLPCSPI